MAFTSYQFFLAILQIITGSINTLSTKWADDLKSKGIDGEVRNFKHPFVQACSMFLGEIMCLVTFKIIYWTLRRRQDGSENTNGLVKGNRNFNPFILYIPAICDMVATSLMYIGLNLTYASSFQMFRGAVIIFVAFLSVAFLQRRLGAREWIGIVIVFVGLLIVGAADFISPKTVSLNADHTRNDIITGDLLIVLAQIITAVQMVYEERYVSGMDIPALQAVGYEGLFGFITLGALLFPFYYINVGPPFTDDPTKVVPLESLPDALIQMKNNWFIILAIAGTIVSIAFFNFAGISVTKEISATSRMVLDSVRTLVIWLFSLLVRWETFDYLQLIGFIVLLFGMCLYNNIIVLQTYRKIADLLSRRRNYGNVVNEPNIVESQPADETENEV